MVLGFAGKAQVGKTTCANFLRDGREFRTLSYAKGVKTECHAFLGELGVDFRREHLYGDYKQKEELLFLPEYWQALRLVPEFLEFVYLTNHDDLGRPSLTFKPRQLMQWWGTNYRRAQDVDYWVKLAMGSVRNAEAAGVDTVIDDVRFPSEVEAIQKEGGKVCYLIRKARPEIAGAVHESETALDGYAGFDKYIVNNGTLDALCSRVTDWYDSLVPLQEAQS
jgi:hypothetical protein